MGLFGDSRYARLRRWGYGASRSFGPVTLSGDAAAYAFPWPSVGLYLEPGELSVGLRLDGGMTDALLAVSVSIKLPARVTDWIHRLVPYEDEYMGPDAAPKGERDGG